MATREDRQVEQDFRNKLKLEKTFRPEVKSIFSRMIKSFAVVVARNGIAPDASHYQGEWEGALRKHYERTQNMFSGTVRNFQGKFLPDWDLKQDEEDEDATLFAFALQQWSEEHSIQSSEQITGTNQKNFNDSVLKARQMLVEEGDQFNNRDLALTAVSLLRRKFGGRIETITSFETQSAAESTKLVEAEITIGIEPFNLAPASFLVVTAKKKWRTKGDKLVRKSPFDHVSADFQVVKVNEPFNVSGELLMFPGDLSRGASLGNTAGCRCSAIYDL